MTYQSILSDLKKKNYKPIYFLFGEEPYYIDKITDYIAENVLTESEKAFNQTVLYGKDTLVEDIINSAKRFPMMANHQVIIVKEAQYLKNIDKLIFYAEKPLESTILVFNYKYKKLDGRSKLSKVLKKSAVFFESSRLYENQIPAWINTYLKSKNYSATPKATQLLTEFLGNDLSKITNELDKYIISLPEGTTINDEHIEQNTGISKDFNSFELQNAIIYKNVLKANKIVKYLAQNNRTAPLPMIISTLAYFFIKVLNYHFLQDKSESNAVAMLKVHRFFLKDYVTAARNYNVKKTISIISMLREYDMKAKGYNNVSAKEEDLLKELIFKIMH